MWSDILPRLVWPGVESTIDKLKTMDLKRKRINRAGRLSAKLLLHGRYIIHNIDPVTPGLLKVDGKHLTDIGNRIFLQAFKEALCHFFTDPAILMYDATR